MTHPRNPSLTDSDLRRIRDRAAAIRFGTVGSLTEGQPYEERPIVSESTEARELQALVNRDVLALIAEIERLRCQSRSDD